MVTVVCAVALPFAPVSVNEPTITWPSDSARPTPTLLALTAYRPLAMDVRFSCEVARLAQSAAAPGVVLATVEPALPEAGKLGLIVTARDGRLVVRAVDRVLVDEPIPLGDCGYQIAASGGGLPEVFDEPPDVDQVDLGPPGHVTVTRDGVPLARATAPVLPDVDMLDTSLSTLPPQLQDDLSVTIRVDDEFTSSPTPLKSGLIGVVCAGLLATALLLWRVDRTTERSRQPRRRALPQVGDVVVLAVVLFWMLVAPATDDDGYYGAMARNAVHSGDVGNYYQLYDQNFTPFTWFYQVLGWWEQLTGPAPVLMRVPAAAFGLLTWLIVRRFGMIAAEGWTPERRWLRDLVGAVLAVCFLAWWIPQDMGVRPEGVVAFCSSAAMLAILAGTRRNRMLFAWIAFAFAGLGFAAHPTGFVLLAPLLAGAPLVWRLVRVAERPGLSALRVLAVASGGVVAALVAFSDGALRDFLRGQQIFLSMQTQEGWTTEIQRYAFLLTDNPMGNFAKRGIVLISLVAIVWFLVLATAARVRRIPLPTPLWLAAATTAFSFALLWLTPSKWTHHFGALAGVGATFVGLLVVSAPALTRRVLQGRRLPVGVIVAVAASTVIAISLGWHGPNVWPYAWLDGVRRPELPPKVWFVAFDNPLWWTLGLLVLGGGLAFAVRHRHVTDRVGSMIAVPLIAVVVSLLVTVVYTVGTFGVAAWHGTPPDSVWARSLADPTATDCAAAGAVRVLDPTQPHPLVAAGGLPVPPASPDFRPDGYYPGDQPIGAAATTTQAWGSLFAEEGRAPERTVGEMSTAWYSLPTGQSPASSVAVLAAGTLADGNSLTAVYGRVAAGAVAEVGTEKISDDQQSPIWRTMALAPPAGATVVQLRAVDAAGGPHGWLAFTAPAEHRVVTLSELVPRDAPVALAWQLAFNYPCQRQPVVADGITENPTFGVAWGRPASGGMNDGVWQPARGGLFARVPRSQSVLQLAAAPPADPYIVVYAFRTTRPDGEYSLTRERRTVLGGSTATG